MLDLETLLSRIVVLPVITLDDAASAAPLAHALAEAGLAAVEITLRTSAALAGIAAMKQAEPRLVIGAGTILNAVDLDHAMAAGAAFGVSPGATKTLLAAIIDRDFPFVPGVATSSEIMAAQDAGFRFMKFFPAEASGGKAALRGFAGPFANTRFCPTGGINEKSAPDYLALPNVICVGGSWIAPPDLIAARDWPEITRRAQASLALRPQLPLRIHE